MSHQPERKEKNCLNCGTMVHGRFCHVCGQENVVTHQNFWSLTKHFIFDIPHFDGKFFDTLRFLLFKPGFVAKEYVQGKRLKYLDPIRMYLFTSAFFFLIFFSFKEPEFEVNNAQNDRFVNRAERIRLTRRLNEELSKLPGDSSLLLKIRLLQDTTKPVRLSEVNSGKSYAIIDINGNDYRTVEEYDSMQKRLAPEKRDGWLTRKMIRKGIETNKKYEGNPEKGIQDFSKSFFHRLPYMLFISLPFFALILKLFYKRRKNFYYSDHAVFTLYHYIFSFFLLLFVFLFDALRKWTGWGLFGYFMAALIIWWLVYLYKSLRRFYEQGRGVTVAKFLAINLFAFLVVFGLFIIFIFFSIFQM